MQGFMLEGGIGCRLFQKLNLELDHHIYHLSLQSIKEDACSIFFFCQGMEIGPQPIAGHNYWTLRRQVPFHQYIIKVLRMWMLMNLLTNSINDFNLSVLKFASQFCQGFSTWQWINSAKSITKTARKSSSLPLVMISTGSRNTWWTNRHDFFLDDIITSFPKSVFGSP